MRMSSRKLGIILYITTTVVSAQAQSPEANDPNANQSVYLNETPESVLNYWTDERKRLATPMYAPRISESELEALVKRKSEGVKPPTDIPGWDVRISGIVNEADVNMTPYYHAGKFFSTILGRNWQCSAEFVGGYTVMTAAHCVQDRGGAWATNLLFERAYRQGGFQQRVPIVCPGIKRGWVIEGWNYDYAFLKAAEQSSSGYMGLVTGLPASSWEAVGYPGDFHAGVVMGKVFGTRGVMSGGVVEMVGNTMERGSSGGAWHVAGTAIGLTSFEQSSGGNNWSPYFDSNVSDLWRYTNNNCRN
jgi:hypothetical protein